MIHPIEFPLSRNNEEAEKKVFEILKKQLSENYDIFYSKTFVATEKGEKPEYEIDFIIAKPHKAILVLEVKGGVMKYNGFDWLQDDRKMEKDPIKQATSAAHSLSRRFAHLNMATDWALCFPRCSKRNNIPLTTTNDFNLIDETSLPYISEYIDDIFRNIEKKYIEKKGCSQKEYEDFKELLTRELDFHQPYNTQLLYDEELIQKFTDEQYKLYADIIKANDRVLVSGVAGSGKTLLASKIALDFAKEGKNVLFLCYNKMLGNKLKRDLVAKDYFTNYLEATQLVANYFEDFAKKTINDAEWWTTTYEKRKKNKEVNEFFIFDVSEKLEKINKEMRNTIDVLIIDEAQDFQDDFCFSVLFEYVKKDGGKILLFQDVMQDLFDNKMKLPEQYKKDFMPFPLKRNCRSSKEIIEKLKELNNEIYLDDNTPQGICELQRVDKNAEMKLTIEKEINKLVKEDKIIDLSKIVIISNLPKEGSCFAGVSQIAGFDLVELNEQGEFEKNKIHYATIHKFKGLECDIVFVVSDLRHNEATKEKVKKILYTLISRAKYRAYIYF
jgi:hypothetical protein